MNYIKGKSGAWNDITGNKYNMLTVLGYVGSSKWNCKCECGNTKILRTAKITTGQTMSCGCLAKNNATKHGAVGTLEYQSWTGMKARCTNANNPSYLNYGGRGITICNRWLNSFENFLDDMGNCPLGHSIDRINNSKGYYKENCEWKTSQQQALNRRNNDLQTYKNETKPLKKWCDELNINYKKIYARIHTLNWSTEKAFRT